MKNVLLTFLTAATLFVGLSKPYAVAQDSGGDNVSSIVEATLDIDPVEQKTLAWCWLSVGEMIFTYLDLDEPRSGYQCGTIAMIGGPLSVCWANCSACPVPSGTTQRLENMIRDYPKAIALYQGEVPPSSLTLLSRDGVLSWDEVKKQILEKSPVVAAINPLDPSKPVPQHVALIVGFKENGDKRMLLVNDPAPYSVLGIDPYGDNGGEEEQDYQYWIEYSKFKTGMAWNYSAYNIHDPSHHKNVNDLGISLKYSSIKTTATATTTHPNDSTGDQQTYLPLDQTLPKWVQESANNFADNRLTSPHATFATPGFDYLGDKRQCEITDPDRHQCVFSLYGGTDSEEAQSHYSRLDGILAAVFPDWATTDISSPIDAAGGKIKILRKRTRSNGNLSVVLDKEDAPQPDDVNYYMVDLTFIWKPK